MELNMHKNNNMLYVCISGELDHHVAAQIREAVDDELAEDLALKNIEFDFKDLSFMDSSGIGVIMGRYKVAKSRGGRVYASNVKPQVKKLLSISGLMNILTVI